MAEMVVGSEVGSEIASEGLAPLRAQLSDMQAQLTARDAELSAMSAQVLFLSVSVSLSVPLLHGLLASTAAHHPRFSVNKSSGKASSRAQPHKCSEDGQDWGKLTGLSRLWTIKPIRLC